MHILVKPQIMAQSELVVYLLYLACSYLVIKEPNVFHYCIFQEEQFFWQI